MLYRLLLVSTILLLTTTQASAADCLKYEPEFVELKGKIRRVIFPGPPNYESIKAGDEPETYYVLFLAKEVCVQGDPKDEVNSEEENGVRSIQLITSDYKRYRPLLNSNVSVRGKLMHAHTGHHHTSVLMQVEEMSKITASP